MDKADQVLQAVEKVAQRVKFLEYKINLLMENTKTSDGVETVLSRWTTYKDKKNETSS